MEYTYASLAASLHAHALELAVISLVLLVGGMVGFARAARKEGPVLFCALGLVAAAITTAAIFSKPESPSLRPEIWVVETKEPPRLCEDISCDYI